MILHVERLTGGLEPKVSTVSYSVWVTKCAASPCLPPLPSPTWPAGSRGAYVPFGISLHGWCMVVWSSPGKSTHDQLAVLASLANDSLEADVRAPRRRLQERLHARRRRRRSQRGVGRGIGGRTRRDAGASRGCVQGHGQSSPSEDGHCPRVRAR